MIEQWGTIAGNNHKYQITDIKFPILFFNTNYYVNTLPFYMEDIGDSNPYDSNYQRIGHNKSVNGITIKDFNAWDSSNVSWFAIGF